MTSSSECVQVTLPLIFWTLDYVVFVSLGLKPVEEFRSEEAFHLLHHASSSWPSTKNTSNNIVFKAKAPHGATDQIQHTDCTRTFCVSHTANHRKTPHPQLPSPSHRCQSHPPGITKRQQARLSKQKASQPHMLTSYIHVPEGKKEAPYFCMSHRVFDC